MVFHQEKNQERILDWNKRQVRGKKLKLEEVRYEETKPVRR